MAIEGDDFRPAMLEYAVNLFSGALREFSVGDFKWADIHAICAYSAASFVKGMSDDDKELNLRATAVASQGWALSKQARSRLFFGNLEPRMNGVQVEYIEDDDVDLICDGIDDLVKEIAYKRRSNFSK